MFISIVLAPISVPYIFLRTNLYRHVGRWVREVHHGMKLECINNMAGKIFSRSGPESISDVSPQNDYVNLDSNNIPLEVLDLVFSSPNLGKFNEAKKFFDTLSVVCKPWHARVEKAKLNVLNAGKVKLRDLPRMDAKSHAFKYIKANAEQLRTLDLLAYN